MTSTDFTKATADLDTTLKKLDPSNSQGIIAYGTAVAPLLGKISSAYGAFQSKMTAQSAPNSQIQATLARIEASDPSLHDLVTIVNNLNTRKATNAQAVAVTLNSVNTALTTINTDVTGISNANQSLSQNISNSLDHSTRVFVKSIGQAQYDRLQKYLYYTTKAFEYRLPGTLVSSSQNLDTYVHQLDSYISAKQASLTTADIANLLALYEAAVRQLLETGTNQVNMQPLPTDGTMTFALSPDELNTLNLTGQVSVNLAEKIPAPSSPNPKQENRRITALSVVAPGTTGLQVETFGQNITSGNLHVEVDYQGPSNVIIGGKTFTFQFGRQGVDVPFSWGATYDLATSAFFPDQQSPSWLSFISALLANQNGSTSQDAPRFAEPGAEATVVITKGVSPANIAAFVKNLRIQVSVDYTRVVDRYVALNIGNNQSAAVSVQLSAGDLGGLQDGVGSFVRHYSQNQSITLTAPPTYGGNAFTAWTDPGGAIVSAARSLTIRMTTDISLVPTYAQGAPQIGIPGGFQLTSPLNGTAISAGSALSWSPASNATSYDVFLGTSFPPVFWKSVSGTAVNPVLSPNTAYYWTVTAKNQLGSTEATSPFYFFTSTQNSQTPVIAQISHSASFLPGIESGSWFTISGVNLSATTRSWSSTDFVGNLLPASLDGVSVSVDGKPAAVYFISPTQINAQVPDDTVLGTVPVVVKNPLGVTASFGAALQAASPGFFVYSATGLNYCIATHLDYTLVGPVGALPGAVTRPATPGEVVVLWGTGFGTATPRVPAGKLSPASPISNVDNVPVVSIGGIPSTVISGVVTPSSVGLYQIAVKVPDSAPSGDLAVLAQVAGFSSAKNVLITVK